MSHRPVIFISATSDLRSARDLVGRILYSMGNEPVWQDMEATDGGELLEVLRRRIEPCALMVQLVGRRYGAEPPQPTAEYGRVSYTQFEALEAERLGIKVIYDFLHDDFPVDPADPEPPELVELQRNYHQRLIDSNRLRQQIADPKDLELSIRRIDDELKKLRRQSLQRHRQLLGLLIAAVSGILLTVILAWSLIGGQLGHRKQLDAVTAQAEHAQQQLAEMNAKFNKLLAAITPTQPAPGESSTAQQFSPEVVEIANKLVAEGDDEQRAAGLIVQGDHDEANRIIQQLKSQQRDKEFDLVMLEGDNWYQANQPDRAIEPYERAVSLKPGDFRARNGLLMALITSRQGNLAEKRRRAIQVANETLREVPERSNHWAITQHNLGGAWLRLPAANNAEKAAQLRNALQAYESALTVHTRDGDPLHWASAQHNIGLVWYELPTASSAERNANLQHAIEAYGNALLFRTKGDSPFNWAMTQNNLGNAWSELPAADDAEKGENLQQSLTACRNALTVFTKLDHPTEWATATHNLANTLRELPAATSADKVANLEQALAAYESALTVFTLDSDPVAWASTQLNLAKTWRAFPAADDAGKRAKLKEAIGAYEQTLKVYTPQAYPAKWAVVQNSLGNTRRELPASTDAERAANLLSAIAAYQQGLAFGTKDVDPLNWASMQYNLGNALRELPAASDLEKAANLSNAIAAYEQALTVYTKEAYPSDWGQTQRLLGRAWWALPSDNEVQRAENLHKSIAAYQLALSIELKSIETRLSLITNCSWAQLHVRDYAGALATTQRAADAGLHDLPVETNRAHALLLLGRVDEAKQIYLEHVGKEIPGTGKTWQQVILKDFDDLEKAGVSSPEFATIRELLTSDQTTP